MRTSKTFSIQFWADLHRARNKKALIYARVTVNQKRVSISLKKRISVDLWNPKLKRAKSDSVEARNFNQYLDEVYTQLFQEYQDLKYKGQLVTAKLIKDNYLGDGKTSKTLQTLLNYHSKKIERTLAAGTIRNFNVTESYLHRFLSQVKKTSDIYLKELDFEFLYDFESFLQEYWPKGHHKAMSHNTVMKHIQRLRKIVTLGYHLEWIDKDPFIRWKTTFEKKEREFLSENELSKLEFYKFPIERLDRVRDLFVFSCYTGISYVDIMNLTAKNVSVGIDGNTWIFTNRQKTKTKIKIPLLDIPQKLVEKYQGHPMTLISESLFPRITNEKLNLYLKEIADACGIKKNLTFHMARHTFATTVTLTNGVPIETVSKLLGHTKLSTTQIYARVIECKLSDDMQMLREKLNKVQKTRERI